MVTPARVSVTPARVTPAIASGSVDLQARTRGHPCSHEREVGAVTRPIPASLAGLRAELDLRNARGRPTALARLVLVILLLHANDRMHAWPSHERLAKLTDSKPTGVGKALRLLADRGAIERETASIRGSPRLVWRIKLATQAGDLEPRLRVRCFWPGPQAGPDNARTAALRALMHAIGNRNRVAAIVMLYQFARQPKIGELADDHPARHPRPPNHAWIARVLDTTAHTVRRAKRECIERGLATEHERGLLVFANPVRWPAILGCPDLAPPDLAPPNQAPLECELAIEIVRREAANGGRYSC